MDLSITGVGVVRPTPNQQVVRRALSVIGVFGTVARMRTQAADHEAGAQAVIDAARVAMVSQALAARAVDDVGAVKRAMTHLESAPLEGPLSARGSRRLGVHEASTIPAFAIASGAHATARSASRGTPGDLDWNFSDVAGSHRPDLSTPVALAADEW